MVLLDLQSAKTIDTTYNDTTYIDEEIIKNGMIVSGDIVFVDGWQFEIDRNVPEILVSLGKGVREENIGINITSQVTSDYVKANVVIEINYEEEIEKIIINGEEISQIPQPEKQEGKNVYRIEKEERDNKTYMVIAKDTKDRYNMASIKITDITEDMEIWNKQDMEKFRDKVNNGRTFEGRTARLMDDIDLEGTEQNQWVPIGIESKTSFKGTFDGNNKEVIGIYINNTAWNQGLFGCTLEANIRNIELKNSNIIGGVHVGGIVGYCGKTTIENCIIDKSTLVKAISTSQYGSYVGGIVGTSEGGGISIVRRCINKGNVYGKYAHVGGIIGVLRGTVEECINTGEVSGPTNAVGGIAGYVHVSEKIIDSYNKGKISANARVGGILGTTDRWVHCTK